MTRTLRWLLPTVAVLALGAVPALAQDWEYESDEGLHEEEWYDPSDWDIWGADEPGVSDENDWTERWDWGREGTGARNERGVYDDDTGVFRREDGSQRQPAGQGGLQFRRDDYGSYDSTLKWDTDEDWFDDWYGDADEWF